MIYLASAYSTPKLDQIDYLERRYQEALHATKHLIEDGFNIFSPIVHCHNLNAEKVDAQSWYAYNRDFILASDCLFVLESERWRESYGVRGEIELAREIDKRLYRVYWNKELKKYENSRVDNGFEEWIRI